MQKHKLIIHSATHSPRLKYIANQLFGEWYGIELYFEEVSLPKGFYKILDFDAQLLHESYSDILFGKGLNFSVDFEGLKTNNLTGDWLGACFFLLSRMEEYKLDKPDMHNRFHYSESVAHKERFLHLPVIDRIANRFVELHFPDLASKKKTVEIIPTLDIDMTHGYLGRSFWRQSAALIRDFLKGNLKARLDVLRKKTPDPFDNFDYQLEFFKKSGLVANYFFQVGAYSQFDKNISVYHPLFLPILQKVKEHIIGLHPSYYSSEKVELFSKEKTLLEQVLGKTIEHSRQHFLRFTLPQTYRDLLTIGIKKEYSMGYSETLGFRAGTSRPFFWYDIENECVTVLSIQPFCVMDVALKNFMKLSPEKSIEKIKELKNTQKECGGCFSFCFHNESLSENNQWIGWRKVFEEACNPA